MLRGSTWIIFAALTVGYIAVELRYAANRPMWLDERYALSTSIRGQGFVQLLLDGASGQGSPSPLDFVLVKVLDGARTGVRYLGLPPHAYFRLVGLLSTVGAGIFAFLLTLRGPGDSPTSETGVTMGLFAILAFASFVLQPLVVHYAAEMRPYALWTALWLVSALSLLRTSRRWRTVSLIALVLLSMAATASVFQLAALATGTLSVGLVGKRRLVDISKDVIGLFSLPFAISLFYCLKAHRWDYPADMCAWARFLPFWASRWWVAAASVIAALLCLRRQETRGYAVPPLSLVILYLMGPGIFLLTKRSGMFFAEKQYIYYASALPILFATSSFVLSAYGSAATRRTRGIVAASAAALCILGAAYSARGKVSVAAHAWKEWKEAAGVPSDSSGILSGLLARELPRAFCFTNRASMEAIENVSLVAEWMPVRYASLPIGGKTVLVEARGDGAEVVGLGDSCEPNAAIPVVGNRRR